MKPAWLMIRVDLAETEEVLAVADALGVDPDLVAGKLVRFWAWATARTTDGLVRVGISTVDRMLSIPGITAALMDEGLLELDPERGVRLGWWEEWLSPTAKARAGDTTARAQRRGGGVGRGGGEQGASWRPGPKAQEVRTSPEQAGKTQHECPDTCPPNVRTDVRELSGQASGPRARAASKEQEEDKDRSKASKGRELHPDAPARGDDAEPALPASELSRWEICSLLAQIPGMTPAGARAISDDPAVKESTIAWAIERLGQEQRKARTGKRTEIENPAGYVRQLIEYEQPPEAWVTKFRRAQMAKQAARVQMSKGATA